MKRKYMYVLHIYWDDDITIECRYFETMKDAEQFANNNGIENYAITKEIYGPY